MTYSATTAEGETTETTETFDYVLVATGRHGGGGFIPQLENQEHFKGQIMHSSQYKFPEKHGLVGKACAVVGIGNSVSSRSFASSFRSLAGASFFASAKHLRQRSGCTGMRHRN